MTDHVENHPPVAEHPAFYPTTGIDPDNGKTFERWRFCTFGEGCFIDESSGVSADAIGRIQETCWQELAGDRLEIYHRALSVSHEERYKLRTAFRDANETANRWRDWRKSRAR